MKTIDLNLIFKLSIAFAILIMGFSAFYYYVIFLPQQEEEKLELQKEASIRETLIEQQKLELQREEQEGSKLETAMQRARLNDCLDIAEQYTIDAFDSVCPGFKAGKGGACKSDIDISQLIDVLNKKEEEDKAECYKKYPQK